MFYFVTFGKFGREEHWKNDRKIFLDKLRDLIADYTGNLIDYKESSEKEIVKLLKPILRKKYSSIFFISDYLDDFIARFGLSYKVLTKKEKEEVIDMDFTFENWSKKSEELYNNYVERNKKILPEKIHFCLDYRFFVMTILVDHECNFTLNNFLRKIRDYFILEKEKVLLERFMDLDEFDKIRNKVINIYPELKEKYGYNRTIDKNFLSYFDSSNDYNYEVVAKILDDYYNNKEDNNINNDESIRLKNN